MELLTRVLQIGAGEEIETTLAAQDYGLTRFAGNIIHQNMQEEDAILSVRLARRGRVGSCATNQLDADGILLAVQRAREIAELNQPNPDFDGFAPPQTLPGVRGQVYYPQTAAAGSPHRATLARRLVEKVVHSAFEAAGAVSSGSYASAVATSCGQRAYQLETRCHALTVVNRPGLAGFGTGYAEWYGRDLAQLSPEGAAEQALSISVRNENQQAIEPGEYTVVLAPNAVGLLLYYLSWMGLHARSVRSRQSFLTDRWGQNVLDEKISIWDDGLDGNLYAIPFDWEGTPKQFVDIINHGKAAGVVYDSQTARRDGRASSGHALSTLRDRYYSSPLPAHLVMAAGQNSLEEMIASTERGVLINHLWYVREVHYGRTIVTGMTRDGTFWIKNGKIDHALRNLRFTQSIAEALQQVEMVGNTRKLSEQFIGATFTPALKLKGFNIVGASTF